MDSQFSSGDWSGLYNYIKTYTKVHHTEYAPMPNSEVVLSTWGNTNVFSHYPIAVVSLTYGAGETFACENVSDATKQIIVGKNSVPHILSDSTFNIKAITTGNEDLWHDLACKIDS